jgi:hypothetical protein
MGEKATKENESHALESLFVEGEVLPGNALPIGGAHQSGDGVSFVLFSRHATRVHLGQRLLCGQEHCFGSGASSDR